MNLLGKIFGENSPIGQMLQQNKPHTKPNGVNDLSSAKMVSPVQDRVEKHNNATIGTNVFYRAMSTQFTASMQFAADFTESIKAVEEQNKSLFDFEKVAENVLAFIGKTVRGAKSDGATDDKVSSLLDHAREGVLKGVNDAKAELGDLNMLDDELNQGIDKSQHLINKGIDDLREALLPKQTSDIEGEPINRSQQMFAGSYASSEVSSNLSITTADGDEVTISFSGYRESMQSEYAGVSQNGSGSQYVYGYQQQSYSEMNFSYKVEGELDDDEREAIAVLIKDINSVQKEFFTGDVEAAYEKALTLGIKSEEITNVALNLAKVETSVVAQAYKDIASLAETDDVSNEQDLAQIAQPIADYAERFNQLQDIADKILAANREYFRELVQQVLKADTPAEPGIFNDKMARIQPVNEALYKPIAEQS